MSQEAIAQAAPRRPVTPLQHLSVLVVDDNRHMLNLVKTILHAIGIKNVRLATDAAEAFNEIKHSPVDIIITDWNMAPLDGLDFVRLIRKGSDSPNPNIPIIMLTGHTEMRLVLEARREGVNEVLAKPVSIEAIYSRIRAITDAAALPLSVN
jgi:CheY-like chemotaxis protein